MPRITHHVHERKQSYAQVRKLDGTLIVSTDTIAGKSARTRWLNRLGRDVGTVLNEWTVDDGRPRPWWVTEALTAAK